MTWRPASLRGVRVGPVPPLHRYYQDATTPCRSSRVSSLSLDRRYRLCTCPSLPTGTGAAPVGLVLLSRSPPAPSSGNGRASHVPGRPSCVFALLSDPGRTSASGHQRCSGTAPAGSKTRAPAKRISRLNHTASTLAVYASQRRLPDHRARLASGCWPGFAGWDWLPTGSLRKVSSSEHYPPFPDFVARRTTLCAQGLVRLLPS